MKKLIVLALAVAVVLSALPSMISAQGAYIIRVEYDANQNPIYVGFANPGTAESAAGWQIQKITYDANNNPTAVNYPNGSEAYVFKWSLRATYTYSAPAPK